MVSEKVIHKGGDYHERRKKDKENPGKGRVRGEEFPKGRDEIIMDCEDNGKHKRDNKRPHVYSFHAFVRNEDYDF